jgi:hypothetical protein
VKLERINHFGEFNHIIQAHDGLLPLTELLRSPDRELQTITLTNLTNIAAGGEDDDHTFRLAMLEQNILVPLAKFINPNQV